MNLPHMPVREFSLGNVRRKGPINWFLVVLWALLTLLLLRCAPPVGNVPARARIVPAALQPSGVPGIEAARRLSTEADGRHAIAAGKVGDARSGLQDSQAAIQGLVGEVKRLHELKTANESDLLRLYNQLVEQEKRFGLMMMQLSDASTALESGRLLGRQLSEALAASQALVAAGDAERAHLRAMLIQSQQDAQAQQDAADRNSKLAAANAARADQAKGTVKVLLWISLGLGLVIILYILSRIYLPRIP